ncbi:MAG TPA: Gfo/Idh/MocA family oxidoreductase [Phycisphaerales bacterium]|nr:Gfo/Idh/MocA family oxidoreductase [Phycisphaerales bacterium]HRQ75658.1 Gfo/Idh/MocA family oxidoreductase [Phycisphaerales bacterium]
MSDCTHPNAEPHHHSDAAIVDASRRSFLAKAAALTGAAAGLSAVASSAAAASLKPIIAAPVLPLGRNETIRLGVIGTGGMGRGHCDSIIRLASVSGSGGENVQIVAVADCWHENRRKGYEICSRQEGVKVDQYVDYRELLAREDIHGVLIASPEHWHAKMAIDAVAAGKHIYLEKPMTLHLDEALELRRHVRANPQIMFQVGTQMMRLPRYHEARKLIRAGAIGPVTFSQTSYCRNSKTGEWNYYHVDPKWKPGVDVDWEAWLGPIGPHPWDPYVLNRWRRYKKFSTGIIGDLLVHVLTPLMLAVDAGWPVRVTGSGSHIVDKAMENHDQVNLTVEFENGHIMQVAGSTCNEVGLETLIRGHKANIYLGSRHCVVRPERIYSDEIDQETIECPDIGNDQEQHRIEWLQSIRSGQAPSSDIEFGTKVMVVVDLASRSMWEGCAFRFDPQTMKASRA